MWCGWDKLPHASILTFTCSVSQFMSSQGKLRIAVTPEFVAQYYFVAAIENVRCCKEKKHFNEKMPHALTAIIMFQCCVEAYTNFQITRMKKAESLIDIRQRGSTKTLRLWDASIMQKLEHLPLIIAKKTFNKRDGSFVEFGNLVRMRNDLVHLNYNKFNFAFEVPEGTRASDVMKILFAPTYLMADHPISSCYTLCATAEAVVRTLLTQMHEFIGGKPPKWLDGETIDIVTCKVGKPLP